MFDSLSKGNNPDRMKGALYVLGNKGTSECGLSVTTMPHTESFRRESCIHNGWYDTKWLLSLGLHLRRSGAAEAILGFLAGMSTGRESMDPLYSSYLD